VGDDSPPAEVVFSPLHKLALDQSLYALYVGRVCPGEIAHNSRLIHDLVQTGIVGWRERAQGQSGCGEGRDKVSVCHGVTLT